MFLSIVVLMHKDCSHNHIRDAFFFLDSNNVVSVKPDICMEFTIIFKNGVSYTVIEGNALCNDIFNFVHVFFISNSEIHSQLIVFGIIEAITKVH